MNKYTRTFVAAISGLLLAACQQHSPSDSLTNPVGTSDSDAQSYCQQLQAIKGTKAPDPLPEKFRGNEQAGACWSQAERAWNNRDWGARATHTAAPDPANGLIGAQPASAASAKH